MRLIEHPQAVGDVYNIGSDREVTILELAERIKSLTCSDSEIVFTPYEQVYEEGFEDMLRRMPDISKIQRLIDYQPTFNLDEILESVIDYQRSKLEARFGAPTPTLFQT
jgi:UDP-glucose 4-epimerase